MGSSAGRSKRGGACPVNCKVVVLLLAAILFSIDAGSVRSQAYALGNWFSEIFIGFTVPLASSPASSEYTGGKESGKAYSTKGDAWRMKALTNLEEEDLDEGLHEPLRRQLRRSRQVSYISYGALTSRYTPCPPGSGRSYYTRKCKSARGAVRPYTRGCSRISNCARG